MAGEPLQHTDLDDRGVPGDRAVYAIDRRGEIVSGRTRPGLLALEGTTGPDGEPLVDGHPWPSAAAAALVRDAAGADARLVAAEGPERFDILPLLVATDGAIAAFGRDGRRLRPNVVVGGVEGLAERGWEHTLLAAGEAIIGLADLRGRCIITTWDPGTHEQDVDVLRDIRRRFDGRLALNAWTARPGRVAVGDVVAPVTLEPEEVRLPEFGRLR